MLSSNALLQVNYLFCCVASAYVLIILEIMCILNGQEDVLHV
jgi:hypothetical protein